LVFPSEFSSNNQWLLHFQVSLVYIVDRAHKINFWLLCRHTVTMEISSAIPWLNAVRSVTQHSPKLCCWAYSKNLKNYWMIMMELLILTPRTLQLSRYCFESFWLLLYIVIRVATGQEMVREKIFFFGWGRVREFYFESRKLYILKKNQSKIEIPNF